MHKTKSIYFHFIVFAIFLLSFSFEGYCQEIPEKKHPDKAVQDYINLLSEDEQRLLNIKLKNYADTTSTGIAIAIRNDIKDDINFYAAKMLTEWGLGQAEEDNGILLVLDTNQRKIAISTGYGVEHLLTDALSKRIITNIITPQFKQGNFYSGLDKGTSAIIQIMNGEYKGSPQRSNDGGDGIPFVFIILFLIILFIILSNRNKRNRGNKGNRGNRRDDVARSILEAIILSRSGRGGFGGGGGFGGSSGGGSFGGGGFGGFGGGMGGGGGASGSW
ncbi:TPM domain-containing protein [Aureibaculum conchae]|uniref:TPM domain-containing protein n=1 Tax=Aureibaculum sp. 2308TA14-22 TaxID=3108392 RepID=UPI003394519F